MCTCRRVDGIEPGRSASRYPWTLASDRAFGRPRYIPAMADVWTGHVLLPDQTAISGNELHPKCSNSCSRVADIVLVSHNAAGTRLPTAPLRFLATVDTARIPLCLAAGPSFHVQTTSRATEEWFASLLLSTPAAVDASERPPGEWWTWARAQSPLGILVQVADHDNSDEDQAHHLQRPRTTEILFYGTVATPAHGALPTPPSSSPVPSHASPDGHLLPELTVHALPLSSALLNKHPEFPRRTASPTSHVGIEPQFLPPAYLSPEHTPSSPKRTRDIFDEAAQARKKARSKGGEGIAAAAAKAQDSHRAFNHRKSLSIDTKASPFPDSRPSSAHALARPSSRPLSRSPSISSDVRPLSRKGASDSQAKRSALSQVETVPLQPEPTTESRNKAALSRVVMAAMRMHGLEQRKKTKSRRNSVAPGIHVDEPLSDAAAMEEAAKDEEYKLIYHQTYKSAVLAFRKHMSSKPLHSQPDLLGDVVERLLAVFCTDPLTIPLQNGVPTEPLATPGRQHLGMPGSTHSRASPFDMPGGARPKITRSKTEGDIHTGSPISRRKEEKERLPE